VIAPTSAEAELRAEIAELRAQLGEAEDTLRAIRSGEVEALVVDTDHGPQVFALQGLDAESNRFRGQILAQVRDAVIAVDVGQCVTYLNAAAERQYGVVATTTLGCKLTDVYTVRWLHAEDEVEAMTALRERREWRGENIHITRADCEIFVESTVTVSCADDGNPTGMVAVIRDITSRKAEEATLVAREREFRSLADNTPDILTRLDRNLRHVFVNAAVERATGFKPEEFLGRTNRELGMPADVCDLWEAALRDVFDRRHPRSVDFVFDSPHGPRYYASHLVPEFGSDGAVESVLGVARDVTDAQAAEAAVQVSAERLARAQRAGRVGTWDWDLETGRAEWTDEAWRLFGRSAVADGPVTYELFLSCLHPDDRERAVAATTASLAAGRYQDEFRVCYRDGGEAWLESEGEVVRDATGAAIRMLGTVRDSSTRKRAEDVMRVADQRKDEFLATLAHELRNPLAPIRNGLAILLMGGTPELVESVVAMMERQLGHMVNLVDDLLDVSRVRTGKITLRAERVTLREAIDAAVEACRPIISEKSHTLEVELAAEPLAVIGDRTRLMQVVSNLLTNAAKYSPSGSRILVSARREEGEAVIRVTDTGMGIAPDLLPSLWDLFTQVRDTLDKAQGGLGIGLSLVKKLVELHGGAVAAESAGVGQGSTFTVRLPLAAPSDQPDAPSPIENGSALTAPARRRVLVVDDNVDAAASLAMLLQFSGHTTATAHTGAEALAVIPGFQPDIIFLDIGLPAGLDGYEVARRLRADPAMASTLLVALTGWGSEDDRRKSHDAGFDGHLTKPVAPDAVQALIARYTSLLAGGREQRTSADAATGSE